MKTILTVILGIVLVVVYYGISFLSTAGIITLICWTFGMAFIGWKISFGIWLIMFLIARCFKSTTTVKKGD